MSNDFESQKSYSHAKPVILPQVGSPEYERRLNLKLNEILRDIYFKIDALQSKINDNA
jgi:hypothetical protein